MSGNTTCLYNFSPDNNQKFILLVIVTPIICLVGLIGNILSILTYTRPNLRCCNSGYLVAIAVSDTITITTATALYPVEIAVEYYQLVGLSRVWHAYINVVYTLSNMGPFMSVYMTIGATLERLFCTKHIKLHTKLYAGNRKYIGYLLVMVFSISLNLGKYWEFEARVRPQCENLSRYYVIPTELAMTSASFQFYSFWLYTLTSCIFPFLCLCVMNIQIANSTTVVEEIGSRSILNLALIAHYTNRISRMRKHQVNKVIIMIVVAFLIFNLPGVILSVWELIDLEYLAIHWSFYGFFKDAINMLTVTSASVNFFIYLGFDSKFRKNLCRLCV